MVVRKQNALKRGFVKVEEAGTDNAFAKKIDVPRVGDEFFKRSELDKNPTPDERAEFVVFRLEQFIRSGGRIDEGVSFKKWQVMAKNEIAIAIAEAEDEQEYGETNRRRILFVTAAAVVTIGFWGTAISFQKVEDLVAGLICVIAGSMLLTLAGGKKGNKLYKRLRRRARRERLTHIKHLNKRIRRLELALEAEEQEMKELLRKKRNEL
ncbi:MAG: hypothetical protein CMF69_10690 [Magnetovibrio sp.]|nr:hypothetical protein [Magnetovibrio sp.]